MLQLQRQLRRPKLAEGMDPAKLADMLSASLPEIDRALIAEVGGHLDAIEQLRQEVQALGGLRDQLNRFTGTYRNYARAVVRDRGDRVAGISREHADLERKLDRARRQADETAERLSALADANERRETVLAGTRGAHHELLASDAMRSADELHQRRETVKQTGGHLAQLDEQLARLADEISRADSEAGDAAAACDKAAGELASALTVAADLAERAGIADHDVAAAQLAATARPDAAAKLLRDRAAARQEAIDEQRALRRTADKLTLAQIEAIHRHRIALNADLAAFPADAAAVSAARAVRRSEDDLTRARERARSERGRAEQAAAAAGAAARACHQQADRHDLPRPGRPPDLDALQAAVSDYREHTTRLEYARRAVLDAERQAATAAQRAGRAREQHATLGDQRDEVKLRLAGQQGELKEAEQTDGATAAEVLARRAELETTIKLLEDELRAARDERETLKSREGQLRQAVADDEQRQIDLAGRLDDAVRDFAELDDHGLLARADPRDAPPARAACATGARPHPRAQ